MSVRLVHMGFLLTATLVVTGQVQAQGILYGVANGFGNPVQNLVYQIDPVTASVSNVQTITLPGFTVGRTQAMTAHPATGTLYAVIQTTVDTPIARRLVTLDPNTGIATTVGILDGAFASLAFRANGTLYGVTGELGTFPESLFTISTVDASVTFQFQLGNGVDGETIAFHPNGLLYHSSGIGNPNLAIFESVNVDTQQVIPIGGSNTEMFAMGYLPTTGQLLGSDINTELFTININTGARTRIGDIGELNRGLAFVVTSVPEPATVALLVGGALAGLAYCYRLRQTRRQQLNDVVQEISE